MPAARFQGIRIAGYLALVAAMACFGLALFMSDVWAAGFAVGGLLLVWFAHRVIDAPGRAAKAAAGHAAADAPAKPAASPFNFATVSDDDDDADEDEDDLAPRPHPPAAHEAPAAAPVVVAAAGAAVDTLPSATPPRMRTLEEVRADMALLREAVRASRPVTTAPKDPASAAPAPAPAPAPQAPSRPRPVVDLFARTEVAGLEVSYAPSAEEESAAFPRTQLVGLEREPSNQACDADFPRTQFERPA